MSVDNLEGRLKALWRELENLDLLLRELYIKQNPKRSVEGYYDWKKEVIEEKHGRLRGSVF